MNRRDPLLSLITDVTARRYMLAGFIQTAASYIFLFLIISTLNLSNLVANASAMIFGLSISFLSNRGFVFRYKGPQGAAIARFTGVVAVAYGLNVGALYLLTTVMQISNTVAQFLAFSVYTVVAYVLHRYWTFAG